MARVARRQTHKTRRLYGLITLTILLAATGTGLYRFPPSLLDNSKIIRLAADKISGKSADLASAEPVLRGTIFDRKYNELAVSYPLYSVFVRPLEIGEVAPVAQALSGIIGTTQGVLENQLKQAANIVKVAENLDPDEVREIRERQLPGVYLKEVEERFYPAHEAAASLLGYTGEGIGLAGVEAAYDMVLQQGAFRNDNLPEIDFHGIQTGGKSAMDLVLTVDLALQKEMEEHLQKYLQERKAQKGLALCLDVRTGGILAWAGRPSYNPNYYWKLAESSGSDFFQEAIEPELYRSILARALALVKSGDLGEPLPPETIAATDFGLSEDEIHDFGKLIGLAERRDFWQPLPLSAEFRAGHAGDQGEGTSRQGVNALQLVQGLASLVNGGWYNATHVLGGVYSKGTGEMHGRSKGFDAAARRQVVSPTMGIRLRRELFGQEVREGVGHDTAAKDKNSPIVDDMLVHTATLQRVSPAAGRGIVTQDLFLGAIPSKSPTLLLLMVAEGEEFYPAPKSAGGEAVSMNTLARNILPSLLAAARENGESAPPRQKDPANFSQFLISRRVDFQERHDDSGIPEGKMPELTGLSLRKGLQRLNSYHVLVKIEGSGRIVSQNPTPGAPLQGVNECLLTLSQKP